MHIQSANVLRSNRELLAMEFNQFRLWSLVSVHTNARRNTGTLLFIEGGVYHWTILQLHLEGREGGGERERERERERE